MAKKHGRHGVVLIGAAAVGEIQSWEFTHSIGIDEATSMGDTSIYRETNFKDARGSVTYLHDPADTGQDAIALGDSITLKLYPEGNTTGKEEWTIPCIVAEKGRPQTKDGFVTHSFTFVANGNVTEGVVA